MTLLKDNNYKEINVALLSLEADIKKLSNNGGFDTSVIDRQLAEINNRIDKINAGNNNSSAEINDIRTEIENINSKLVGNSVRIENIEQKLSDIFSAENKVTDFNATTDSGVYYWATDAANRPTDYGVLLVNKYDDGSTTGLWVNQVAYGTNNKIYFRQNINSGNWTEWKAVAFEGGVNATLTVNGKTYNGSEAVDAGVQTVANGGTGATTAKGAQKSLLSDMQTETTEMDDATEFVMKYGTPTDTKGALFKRSATLVWNYIKGKISSVLGLTKDNYGGKSAQSSFLDEYVGAGGTRLTSGNIVPKDASEYGGMRKDVVTSSMTDSGRPGLDGHLLTMFWDSDGRWDNQLFISNDITLPPALKVRQKLNEADYGPWVDVITSQNIGSQTVANAGNADTVDNYHASDLWRKDGGTWNPNANISLGATANGDEWSFDISRNGKTGCFWHVWDSTYGSLLKVNADDGKVYAPYGFIIGSSNAAGSKLTIQGVTVNSNSYTDTNPKLEFKNTDGSQSISLTFTDWDAVQEPASLTLNGNQGNEYFIAPCIKANNKMRIPIGAPSSLEDGCIWIER